MTPSTDTTLAFASPDVVEAELDAIAARWAEARGRGQRIHAHAGTPAASGGEVAELGRRGLLGPDVTLSHCTHLSDADFEAIASSSTAMVLTPASDMAGGAGLPPMQQLIDRGIRPGPRGGRRAARPRRRLRPDAGRHLRAARHIVRPQACRQGRCSELAQHPRRASLRHRRWGEGRRALRHHRLVGTWQACGRHRACEPIVPTSPPSTTRSVPSCGAWTRRTSTGFSSAARHWSSTASSPPM